MFRPEAPSRSSPSSSSLGLRALGEILPDLLLRLGLRCIDYQLRHGRVDEARAITETLNTAVSFERAA